MWFKKKRRRNQIQRLYITVSTTFFFLFILFLFESSLHPPPPFFFGGGGWEATLHVLMFWYDVDWGGSWFWGVRVGGEGCKEACCVYSVQIIACLSAFSLENHKKEEQTQRTQTHLTQRHTQTHTRLRHSHMITRKRKKKHNRSVLSMLSGVTNLLHTSC